MIGGTQDDLRNMQTGEGNEIEKDANMTDIFANLRTCLFLVVFCI